MIAQEIYDARQKLMWEFPTLEFVVVRSARQHRTWVVGVRPVGVKDTPVFIWTPMDGFPNDALRAQLMLVA